MKIFIFLIHILATIESHKVFGNVRIGEASEKRDIFEINKGIKGLVHGDVVPKRPENTKSTMRDETRHWPNTVIPFKYSPGLSLEAIGSIELARQEYRLRTCIDLVEADDTTTNYISFEALEGCWSYVGMVDIGAQAISIGSGCESMAIACHEIMHAIGIWHEQSRADRDDYVQIMWDNIEEGYENIFVKQDWETSDARRVPYDYISLMHYRDSGFSKTGERTIITRDPAFQDIIGKSPTISRGDSEKINKMYKCIETSLVSYNCNYDDGACGYMQDYDTDQIDWMRYEVGDKSISISPVAPSADATLGVSGEGSYMILDTSGKNFGDVGEMRSMRFVTKSEKQCLQFSYYIDKVYSSDATIAAYLATVDDVTGEITSYIGPIVTFSQNSDKKWLVHRMTLRALPVYRIVFRGKAGGYSEDVLAIDDVSILDKPCQDDYFLQQDYSTILNTWVPGVYLESPVMTSSMGYNFRLLIYPNNPAGYASSGYMSIYFGLVQGPNDDNLAWPFCNKYIHFTVVDQNDNPLYALNTYKSFLTKLDQGDNLWNRPGDPERPNGYLGFSKFMSISELQNTHNYLKHDSLMISVLIQDMNWVNGADCTGSFARSAGNPDAKNAKAGHGMHIDLKDRDDDHEDRHNQTGNNHANNLDGDHHYHDDEPSYDHEAVIPVGKAVGITIGCAGFVLIVMAGVVCCVQKSKKRNVKHVANSITLQPRIDMPASYDEGKVSFDALPEKV